MGLEVRPEHHDADGRRNEQQPEMLAESARHFIERSVHASAQREKSEQKDQADDRSGNQRQKEMRDELAQPLKKQDLNEAGDHEARTILSGFYPEPWGRSLKIHANSGTATTTAAPCASRKPGTSPCPIPVNVFVKVRATVTAGLANEVEEVNQYAPVI